MKSSPSSSQHIKPSYGMSNKFVQLPASLFRASLAMLSNVVLVLKHTY